MNESTESSLGLFTSIIKFVQDGGPFMYLIMAVFAVGIAISIERFIYLQNVRRQNRDMWEKIFPLLDQGLGDKALQLAKHSDATIAKIVRYGLERSVYAQYHTEIELAMEEGLMEAIPQLERRTPYLATFANIATLLGLLGTILGLISAFTAVASADPSQKADLLSASISVAMNTTAFGLMTAIPLLLVFSILQSTTAQIIDSMEMASVKLMNTFHKAQNIKNDGS